MGTVHRHGGYPSCTTPSLTSTTINFTISQSLRRNVIVSTTKVDTTTQLSPPQPDAGKPQIQNLSITVRIPKTTPQHRNTSSPKTYITAATTPRDAIDFRDRPHQIERCEISRKEDRNTGERWRSCATTWCPVRIFTSRRHRIQGSREEITQVISSIASRVDVGLGFNRPNVYLVPTSYQNTVLMQV
jgi:hypothetical protein